jgi:iron(III) transport system permease protein
LGYAVPGTVLAIALLTPMALIDDIAVMVVSVFGIEPKALLMGSLGALVLACTLRFLAIVSGGAEAGFARISPSLDHAARGLGAGPLDSLRRVHVPLLRPALAAAALLVFVDTMKELPATLLLRPLGFDTLSTWLYAEAARGTYEEGAVAALLIVMVGLPAVIVLARAGFGERIDRSDHSAFGEADAARFHRSSAKDAEKKPPLPPDRTPTPPTTYDAAP